MKNKEIEARLKELEDARLLHQRQLIGIEHDLRQQRTYLDQLKGRIEAGWSIKADDRARVMELAQEHERLNERLLVLEAE